MPYLETGRAFLISGIMDLLSDYVENNGLSEENILKYIDDYSIYSHYIGQELELDTKYSSPLRLKDDDPSFTLYVSEKYDGIIMFKDHTTGLSGSVFTFLRYLLGIPYNRVYDEIDATFGLGLNSTETDREPVKIVRRPIIKKDPVTIRITSQEYTEEFYQFWERIGVTEEFLQMYNVKQARLLHFIRGKDHSVIIPKDLCIAYPIFDKFKVYQPYSNAKMYKFRNNYPPGYVEGALQLSWKAPFIIITKSTKECIFFRAVFGWEGVAGTSETSKISDVFMQKLFAHYPTVFIWLDADEAGQRAQAEYLEMYPELVPLEATEFLEKDPTDIYLANEDQEVFTYFNHMIESGRKDRKQA